MAKDTKVTKDKNKKIDPHFKKKQAYIQSLKNGSSRVDASEACKAGVTTIWEWKRDDKQFASDIESALEGRIQVVEDALYQSATGKEGKAKIIAQIFWLKNRGKNWKDKQDIEFKAPVIVKQNTFIQAGEAPKVVEEVSKEEAPGNTKETPV